MQSCRSADALLLQYGLVTTDTDGRSILYGTLYLILRDFVDVSFRNKQYRVTLILGAALFLTAKYNNIPEVTVETVDFERTARSTTVVLSTTKNDMDGILSL